MGKEEMGGKCPRQYCTEVAGHAGPCTGDFLPYANLLAQLQQAQRKGAAAWLLFERRCDELRQTIKRAERAEALLETAISVIKNTGHDPDGAGHGALCFGCRVLRRWRDMESAPAEALAQRGESDV